MIRLILSTSLQVDSSNWINAFKNRAVSKNTDTIAAFRCPPANTIVFTNEQSKPEKEIMQLYNSNYQIFTYSGMIHEI